MKAIWKFPVYSTFMAHVSGVPKDALPLHVGLQGDITYIWFLVETNNPVETRTIHILATGQSLTGEEGAYIGTVVRPSLTVWHYFDDIKQFPDHDVPNIFQQAIDTPMATVN
jgi:hypothetical protein